MGTRSADLGRRRIEAVKASGHGIHHAMVEMEPGAHRPT
jgi:hypothetical protein